MIRPVKWLIILCVMMLGTPLARGREPSPPLQPDMEFLEFLGTWETDDGQWVSPLDLMEQSPKDRDPATASPETQRGKKDSQRQRRQEKEYGDSFFSPYPEYGSHD